jgi:hypothetical protein
LIKRLSSQRFNINYKIILKKIFDRKNPKVFWEFLYDMSRGELLVLQKIFTKFLNKNFIRVNSFSAFAFVLFVKKFNEELRFCINYCALNALT